MPIDPIDARKVAVAMALGGIAGAAVVQSHHDQKRKDKAGDCNLACGGPVYAMACQEEAQLGGDNRQPSAHSRCH